MAKERLLVVGFRYLHDGGAGVYSLGVYGELHMEQQEPWAVGPRKPRLFCFWGSLAGFIVS